MEAARAADPAAGLDVDKLTYEIFSILESKFLFGYDDPKLFSAGASPQPGKATPLRAPPLSGKAKVCILSIDGGGRAADGLLAGAALVRLEASLRRRTGDDGARLADFFDVAAGSGAGGVLAAMLVARGPHGRPLFSAEDALAFLLRSLRRGGWSDAGGGGGVLRALFRRPGGGAAFRKVFGDLTLRDTVRPVLVPCYDLATGGPFLFSRADAVETAAYDFRLRDVCAATCAGNGSGRRWRRGRATGPRASRRSAAASRSATLRRPPSRTCSTTSASSRSPPASRTCSSSPSARARARPAAPPSPRPRSSGSPPRASPTWWIRPWPWRSDIIGQATTSAYRRRGRRGARAVGAAAWRRRCWRRRTWSRCYSAGRRWRSRPTPRSWSGSRTSSSRSETAAGPARSRPPPSSSSRRRRSPPAANPRRRRRTRTSSATCSPASCRPPTPSQHGEAK